MFLGIEIGGTKLQLGLGRGDGTIQAIWRGNVDPSSGGEGIRKQIVEAVPTLLASASLSREALLGIGVGFGGPVDDRSQRVLKSHQIPGWDDFPLTEWLGDSVGLPCVMGNDADVAGLAEAKFGAGQHHPSLFYITVGSGIGGGFILHGDIYRAVGRGAAEIGHLRVLDCRETGSVKLCPLEEIASGWAIGKFAQQRIRSGQGGTSRLVTRAAGNPDRVTGQWVGEAAILGDDFARDILQTAINALAEAICAVIVLLCPGCVVIGGGVSLMGEEVFFAPLRRAVAERVFPPFAGLTTIVPATLSEAVVVHGALALARMRWEAGAS